jgi:hypothetical protein
MKLVGRLIIGRQISRTLGKSFAKDLVPKPISSEWILADGTWVDSNKWIDGDVWID